MAAEDALDEGGAQTEIPQTSLFLDGHVQGGMEFERGMFAIIKSLMYLDGMVLRCRPNAVLIEDMRPFIGQRTGLIDGPLAEAQGPRWRRHGAVAA